MIEPEEQPISPVLESLRTDVRIIGELMQQFSMHVINEEISSFPIYIAFQEDISFGRPFLKKDSHQLNWNYNVSFLEEFVKRGAILRSKVEQFMATYGDPEERVCIFVVTDLEGGFVFLPFEVVEGDAENLFLHGMN
jgi:hypothetical protein